MNSSRRHYLGSVVAGSGIVLAGCLNIIQSNKETEKESPRPSRTNTSTPTEPDYQTQTFRTPPDEHKGPLVFSEGGGPIDVEVFSDYALQECEWFWNHIRNRLKDYLTSDIETGDGPYISIILRHFPKPENKWSMFLPCAMLEVRAQQGILAQGEFHDRLFKNHFPDYSIRDVEIAASMVDADPDEVVKAGKERKWNYVINWDLERGKDYDLEGPLRIVVGGQPVWENSYEAIEQSIEREIAQRDL